jgi:hypothetical protein
MNRRQFLKTAAISTTGAPTAPPAVVRASAMSAPNAEFDLPINIVRSRCENFCLMAAIYGKQWV